MDEGIVILASLHFAIVNGSLFCSPVSWASSVGRFCFSFCIYAILLLQKQFAIGVNDVTRVLERMPPATATNSTYSSTEAQTVSGRRRAPLVPLQVSFISYFAFIRNLPMKLEPLDFLCLYIRCKEMWNCSIFVSNTIIFCSVLLVKTKTSVPFCFLRKFSLIFATLNFFFCCILWF